MKYGCEIISSIDFPPNLSLMLFAGGCEFRCPYCHNPELIDNGKDVPIKDIIQKIKKSADFIDGIVISGGEPLHQPEDVKKILKFSKQIGLKTKLDTNGYSPKNLKKLIKYIDYIALDIKAPFDKYEKVIGCDEGENVLKSMEISAKDTDVYLECRTTYVPVLLNYYDIHSIAKNIKCDKYTIQQFRNEIVYNPKLKNTSTPSRDDLINIVKSLVPLLKNISIKTAEFGNEEIIRDNKLNKLIINEKSLNEIKIINSFTKHVSSINRINQNITRLITRNEIANNFEMNTLIGILRYSNPLNLDLFSYDIVNETYKK